MSDASRTRPASGRSFAGLIPSPLSVDYAIYYVLAFVWSVLTVMTALTGGPSFLDPGNVANVLFQTSFVALLAVPMTILLISGNFDLSVGATAALCAACVLVFDDHLGPTAAVLLTLALGGLIGLANGLIVEKVGINAFIVTLGMMTALRGCLLIVTGGRTATSHNAAGMAALRVVGNGEWAAPSPVVVLAALLVISAAGIALRRLPMRTALSLVAVGVLSLLFGSAVTSPWHLAKSVYYAVALACVAWLVTGTTVVGRRLQAVGSNPEAARLAGIRVSLYKISPFALNGVMAAVVGILFATRLGSVLPNAMSGLELTVIAAAILGGTSLFGGSGSVPRSLAGSVLLFTLLNGFDILGLGSSYQGVVEGVVLVAAAAMYTGRAPGRR